MKKRAVYIVVISVIVVSILIGIISRRGSKLVEVSGFTVVSEDFKREVSANGEIISKDSIEIFSTVTGKVINIFMETGDFITGKDPLLSLDIKDLKLQEKNLLNTLDTTRKMVHKELFSLRSSYTQAITAYEQAEREYQRSFDLHKKDFVSEVELQAKKDAYHIANDTLNSARQRLLFREGKTLDDAPSLESSNDSEIIGNSPEVMQARNNLESLNSDIKDYSLYSSINGVITSLTVKEGGVVTPGMIVASVHNVNELEVISNIDEVDLSYIKVGQQVKIESDSFIGTELKGAVTKIAPIIRKIGDSRVCEIRVDVLDNPENIAKIGASCSIFITVENKIDRPAIPVESYFIEKNIKYVFLLEPAIEQDIYTVKKQEIETGILGIETVEVVKGLNINDIIVDSNRNMVLDGDEVEVEIELIPEEGQDEE